ncbi:CDF family Co(II)/Ni(II) efflux transporter DmeF [Azonexus sp.]|uniref:CDF family Co(II)/Ni(II) efflux transporter DmeF n=1 Tax=Azonexus sp. TaxID=1872668 RepID=UPI0039E68020
MASNKPATPAPHDLSRWAQTHDFGGTSPRAEKSTRWVLWITLAMMLIEISAGWWFNSMALLADGWHMSSHALAIGLAAFAYAAARRYADDPSFVFGPWKIEVLAAYTSALFLLLVAALMVWGAAERLLNPSPIAYAEAIAIAILGLIVNALCALILLRAKQPLCSGHSHDHPHAHPHSHAHTHGDDLNLKAAYIHVLTDALTSVLAIAALAGGWWQGWSWLDPACALVGALLVALWAKNLLRDSAHILLGRETDPPLEAAIRQRIQAFDPTLQITDLHLWPVGNARYAGALSLLSHNPALTPLNIRDYLASEGALVHLTVEIHPCDHCPPVPLAPAG